MLRLLVGLSCTLQNREPTTLKPTRHAMRWLSHVMVRLNLDNCTVVCPFSRTQLGLFAAIAYQLLLVDHTINIIYFYYSRDTVMQAYNNIDTAVLETSSQPYTAFGGTSV